jgi:hypothetical protein
MMYAVPQYAGLVTHSLLSKHHTVEQHVCKYTFIYILKESMYFTVPVFTTLTNARDII